MARLIVVGETKESLYCFWSICRVLLCLNKHSIPIDALLGGNKASFFWKPLHIRTPCMLSHNIVCPTRPCLERTEMSSSRTCFALVAFIRGVYLRNLIGKLWPYPGFVLPKLLWDTAFVRATACRLIMPHELKFPAAVCTDAVSPRYIITAARVWFSEANNNIVFSLVGRRTVSDPGVGRNGSFFAHSWPFCNSELIIKDNYVWAFYTALFYCEYSRSTASFYSLISQNIFATILQRALLFLVIEPIVHAIGRYLCVHGDALHPLIVDFLTSLANFAMAKTSWKLHAYLWRAVWTFCWLIID